MIRVQLPYDRFVRLNFRALVNLSECQNKIGIAKPEDSTAPLQTYICGYFHTILAFKEDRADTGTCCWRIRRVRRHEITRKVSFSTHTESESFSAVCMKKPVNFPLRRSSAFNKAIESLLKQPAGFSAVYIVVKRSLLLGRSLCLS